MDLSVFTLGIFPFIKIIIVSYIIFAYLPRFYTLDNRELEPIKSFFRNLVQGISFLTFASYLLVQLKVFEFISVLGVFLIICFLIRFVRNVIISKGEKQEKKPIFMMLLLDLGEPNANIREVFLEYFGERLGFFLRRKLDRFKEGFVIKAIIAIAIIIRFSSRLLYPIANVAMGDPYVHLVWAKMMLSSKLFTDGVYPLGIHSIISTIGIFSSVDFYLVVRFTGILGNAILIIGLYWIIVKSTGKKVYGALGVIIFGFSTYNGIYFDFFRQTLTLPMELSIAFVLPGVVFFNEFLTNNDKRDLLLFSFAVVNVTIIHSYGALFFAICTAVLFLVALFSKLIDIKKAMNILIYGITGAFLGMLPIIVAKMQGIPWHLGSMAWIKNSIKIAPINTIFFELINKISKLPFYVLVIAAVVLVGTLITEILVRKYKKSDQILWVPSILVLMIIFTCLYFGSNSGFSIIEFDRLVLFTGIINMMGTIIFISNLVLLLSKSKINLSFESLIKKNNGRLLANIHRNFSILIIIAFAFLWIIIFPIRFESYDEMQRRVVEYNAAFKNYFSIKEEFPASNWTIIAPVEQYEQALRYGFHYETWLFYEKFTLRDAQNPSFDIPIPTRFLFIYVEKVPLKIWNAADLSIYKDNTTSKYYRDFGMRTKLQKSMWIWCEAYKKSHNNMTVYYEDKEMIIYKVDHEVKK